MTNGQAYLPLCKESNECLSLESLLDQSNLFYYGQRPLNTIPWPNSNFCHNSFNEKEVK